MRAIGNVLLSRWVLSFVLVAALCCAIWFLAPYFGLFEDVLTRLILIVALVAIWLVANLLLDARKRKREKALTEGVVQEDPTAIASAEESAALREKLTQAMELLRKVRGKRGYLYEQPWYVIIGPPGAGKTTALLNAGLQFPLAGELGQGAVAGVGGTRLCDWWFTDEAVLIDTAGRYTTQDSDAAVDRAGWDTFLDLLKRTRVRQPLNGVIVAIALPDVVAARPEERAAHARAIRKRLKELNERLEVHLPVYAVFTKADLLAGFSEFFDDLDREKRGQVWGTTFPLESKGGSPVGPAAGFAAELRALIERLNGRLLERLQAERSPDRRGLIAGFPAQVASLEEPVQQFLTDAFGGTRLDPAPMLRGVYLTSATQEGSPIDRLTGLLSRSFGLDQRRLPSLRPEQGRSYFLARLLREVIFGEAMLVSERPGAARRRWILHGVGYAAALLVLLLGGSLAFTGMTSGDDQIARASTALDAYRAAATPLATDPVNDSDLPRLTPVLDQARALPYGHDSTGSERSFWDFLGLGQSDKLGAGARAVYRHALEDMFLPRLIWRLESQMRGNLGRPDFLYEATRVYLMLGSQGPLDRNLVRAWLTLDWQATYPDPASEPMRTSLARHLDVLLSNPLPAVTLDGALVEAARATFSRVPIADRIYSRVKASQAAQDVPPWRPADALGPAGVRAFVRASGKPLTDGIPGFYTLQGFHGVLLPALGSVAKEVAGESWVTGKRMEVAPDSPELKQVEHDVIQLYEADYEKYWDAMIADLELTPLRSLAGARDELYVLSSPQSPMRDLYESMTRQLTLSKPPPPPPGAAGAAQGAAQQATQGLQAGASSATQRLQGLIGTAAAAEAPAQPPGIEVDEHYKQLRDYVGSGPTAPISGALQAMDGLQKQLAQLAAATPGAAPPPPSGEDPSAALRLQAQSAPAPVAKILTGLASGGTALRGGGVRAQIVAAYTAAGGPLQLCRQAVPGRFPFAAGSTDIPLEDFSRLFSPGGLFDGFFNTQLAPYVDTSGPVWRGRPVDGVAPPVSPADIAQFQRAAKIRDLFFATGGKDPGVRFQITPSQLDSGARQVTLAMDANEIRYAFGPLQSFQVIWPGNPPINTVRVVFDPPPSGGSAALQATGPWSLFHIIAMGSLQREGADRYTLTFQTGDRKAVYEIQAGSVNNPLDLSLLRGFSCPTLQ